MRILLPFLLLLLTAAPLQASAIAGPLLEEAREAFAAPNKADWPGLIRKAKDRPTLATLLRWKYYSLAGTEAAPQDITAFLQQHPDWPGRSALQLQAERRLLEEEDTAALRQWFTTQRPRSTQAVIAHARLLEQAGQKRQARALIRETWTTRPLNRTLEKELLHHFSRVLNADHHAARADMLLWRGYTKAAERLLKKTGKAQQRLITARLALQRRRPGVDAAIARVPASLRNHPGLIFDRMRWRAKSGKWDGVAELLLHLPETVPHARQWWPYRQRLVRDAIEQQHYAKAYRLASSHRQQEGYAKAEALWLSGWIALEFLEQPQEAYSHFHALYSMARYPVSKTRGAFWAGRAADANGNPDIRDNWYDIASAYPATFYGKLAELIVARHAPAVPRPVDKPLRGSIAPVENALADTVRLLVKLEAPHTALRFLTVMMRTANDDKARTQVLALAKTLDQPYLAVKTAKLAAGYGIQHIETAFPTIAQLPGDTPIDRAYALAIARQESEFNPHAQSRAGALGLMQLMPSTARYTAKKIGVRYRKSKLFEPDYNARLGSHYLAYLLERFNGSTVLATAAYNAGPKRVEQWVELFGKPGDRVDTLNWIELIPYAETRNYVQRVLESKAVYQQLAGRRPQAMEQLLAEFIKQRMLLASRE